MSKRVAMLVVAFAIALAGVSFMPAKQALAGSFNAPVLMVHGINVNNQINCNWHPEFGTIRDYFNARGYTNTWSVGFYEYDTNCNDYLWGEWSHCTGWYDSGNNNYTVNEDMRHLSCLLAWYIWDRYTVNGTTISVIAHSLGGILIRQAMNDTPYVVAFPPHLKISDVATAGTPHQGLLTGAAGVWIHTQGCADPCTQVFQMQADNAMMSNMNSTSVRGGFGRNPQGSGGTDWTTMGSDNDEVLQNCAGVERLGAPGSLGDESLCGMMPGAKHFVAYPGPSPIYHHGDYLTDNNTTWNAYEDYSDNNGGTWYVVSNSEHSIYTMYYAILYSTW